MRHATTQEDSGALGGALCCDLCVCLTTPFDAESATRGVSPRPQGLRPLS